MASSNNKQLISIAKPHTIKKFELIESYIETWVQKLLNNPKCKRIVFIDCMCNSGVYQTTEGETVYGTPVRVARILRDAAGQYPSKQIYIYLKDNDSEKIELLKLQLPNFNYTRTIEIAYGISEVDHIHGSVETAIAIGSGTLDEAKNTLVDTEYPTIDKFGGDKYALQELAGYYDYDDEGNSYPNVFIERFFNEVASAATTREKEVFNLLDAKNKDTLETRIKVINSLGEEHYDRVYIMGHSLSEADYSVFNAINKDAEVVCFYYSEDGKSSMEATLKRLGLRYVMIPNSELYR